MTISPLSSLNSSSLNSKQPVVKQPPSPTQATVQQLADKILSDVESHPAEMKKTLNALKGLCTSLGQKLDSLEKKSKPTSSQRDSLHSVATSIDELKNEMQLLGQRLDKIERLLTPPAQNQAAQSRKTEEEVPKLSINVVSRNPQELEKRIQKTASQSIPQRSKFDLSGPEQQTSEESLALIGGGQSRAELQKKGKVIATQFKVNGQVYTDQITRDDVLTDDIAYSKNMIALLKQKNNSSGDGKDQKKIAGEIAYYERALDLATKYKKETDDWLNSDYFRDQIHAADSFSDGIENYISAPINMRYDALIGPNGEKINGFYRLGVISDMSNGFTNQRELNQLKDPNTNKPKKQQILQNIEARIARYERNRKKLTPKQQESLLFAREQLNTMSTAGVSQVAHERERHLQKQMIQLVVAQAKQNPDLLQEALTTGHFHLIHVGLLNQTSVSFDKTGWMHDESNEIADMAEIFKMFNGKRLLFDGKGPSIEGDIIHMPNDQNFPKGLKDKSLKLNANFLNISVHGAGINDGLQLGINQESIAAILKNYENKLTADEIAILEKFNAEEPLGYLEAEAIISILVKMKHAAVSTGCLSAKDRTGATSHFVIHNCIANHAKIAKSPFRDEVLDPNGTAQLVVNDQYKYKNKYVTLKIHPKNVLYLDIPTRKVIGWGLRTLGALAKKTPIREEDYEPRQYKSRYAKAASINNSNSSLSLSSEEDVYSENE